MLLETEQLIDIFLFPAGVFCTQFSLLKVTIVQREKQISSRKNISYFKDCGKMKILFWYHPGLVVFP